MVQNILHRYRRGHGFKSHTGHEFFSGLIFNFKFSCVHGCEDRLHLQNILLLLDATSGWLKLTCAYNKIAKNTVRCLLERIAKGHNNHVLLSWWMIYIVQLVRLLRVQDILLINRAFTTIKWKWGSVYTIFCSEIVWLFVHQLKFMTWSSQQQSKKTSCVLCLVFVTAFRWPHGLLITAKHKANEPHREVINSLGWYFLTPSRG